MPSHEAGSLLEARGLSRSIGQARILHAVDLQLHSGDVLAVVGPNGAGKTTLLRLLAGLMRPSGGEVRVLGERLQTPSDPRRSAVGFVSHHSLLYDDLTLLENLTFAARLNGVPHPGRAARAALESADLAERAGELPPRLSRGLLQRAAIARALIHAPRILLFDEPFTGLDAEAAERLRTELERRRRDGAGVLVVTHQLSEIWSVASRVGALVAGRWVADEARSGDVDSFITRYSGLTRAALD
jgi:heme exporter protein A